MRKWLVYWLARILVRVTRKSRAKRKAKAIIRLAELGRPFERAQFLRIERECFVYGLPPKSSNLTPIQARRLVLDGSKALIEWRETQVRVQTVWNYARRRCKRTGERMPSKRAVLHGLKEV